MPAQRCAGASGAHCFGASLSDAAGAIIENGPGAASNIATEAVVRVAADGSTLLLAASPNAFNATLYDRFNFNFIRDIAPVAGKLRPLAVTTTPNISALAQGPPRAATSGQRRQTVP